MLSPVVLDHTHMVASYRKVSDNLLQCDASWRTTDPAFTCSVLSALLASASSFIGANAANALKPSASSSQ